MSIEAGVVAFEGGELRALSSGSKGREAVLALPQNRLIVRLFRVPAENDPIEFLQPLMKDLSPFPDDPLTVSCEMVRTEENGDKVVLAAALPEEAADDIGEALDAQKLSVVRVDSLALGQLRGVWPSLGESAERRLVLLRSADCLSIFVLDGDQPSAVRALTDSADLRREIVLSLLEAEDFGGTRKLAEIVVVEPEGLSESEAGEVREEGPSEGADLAVPVVPKASTAVDEAVLASFAPVRRLQVGADAALVGVSERSAEEGTLNALPASWQEMLDETRFKRKLSLGLAVAGGIWLLLVAALIGAPKVYDFMTDRQNKMCKQHSRQYNAVKDMKAKAEIIRRYSNHERGALELMRAVSERLPEEITLTSWSYSRDEGLSLVGESESQDPIYTLKENLEALVVGEDESALPIFSAVVLDDKGQSRGLYRFALACRYEDEVR